MADYFPVACADMLSKIGLLVKARRLALGMRQALVGNSDDHPRNHAVIWLEGQWRLSPMYDVLPMLDEGPAKTLAMAVGREGSRVSRSNVLSHHAHFALSREDAEQLLEEVASWEQELKDHYALILSGDDLDMACDAASSVRMLNQAST